ncbi:metal ABC transporter ATP-binding protein [Staphylococcus sp. SQ8-PEA]|uniref:Metal ABC transporter ATP-binding protein n=1 Tax=Staphylococcus marylandisciuri TaxID=2981529 RepID=A0ABT2QSJ8_9STAP|nr:metal ABC transporter ATP-binding protein [Staphylococcus marylandisciuri]MCU5746907.1 metal ABC transporter ATP-binding protein [Staphylococcus marylandisciuri]
MLEVEDLNLRLGNKHVLQHINFSIPLKGEIIGIMGPNGAGKSSLIKSLIGEFKATGRTQLRHKSTTSQLKQITYIPQKAHIDIDFPINVEEVIISGAYQDIGWFKWITPKVKAKLELLLEDLEISSLRKRQLSQLSGGQMQRVLIARALMSDSALYLLDEPFVGIDFLSEQLIIKKIRQLKLENKLVLIVHHDFSKAGDYFDRIMLLNKRLRYFGPSDKATDPEILNDIFLNQAG